MNSILLALVPILFLVFFYVCSGGKQESKLCTLFIKVLPTLEDESPLIDFGFYKLRKWFLPEKSWLFPSRKSQDFPCCESKIRRIWWQIQAKLPCKPRHRTTWQIIELDPNQSSTLPWISNVWRENHKCQFQSDVKRILDLKIFSCLFINQINV